MATKDLEPRKCRRCERTQAEIVGTLIAGPLNTFVCDDCVRRLAEAPMTADATHPCAFCDRAVEEPVSLLSLFRLKKKVLPLEKVLEPNGFVICRECIGLCGDMLRDQQVKVGSR